MKTEQSCEEQTKDLEKINLYCSIERANGFKRNLPKRLENLEMGKGFKIIGPPNILVLRDIIGDTNIKLKTEQCYRQIIDEPGLTYAIRRLD